MIRQAPKEDPEENTSTPFGVHLLSFLCGILVTVLGFKSVRQDYFLLHKLTHLDQFIETSGKILQVKVRGDSLGSKLDYYPDVLFEYFVDGKSIWGWQFSFEELPREKTYWENRLQKYSVGSPVSVYYNAAMPKESILEKKHESLFRNWTKMTLGLGFMLVGLLLTILPMMSLFKRKKPAEK